MVKKKVEFQFQMNNLCKLMINDNHGTYTLCHISLSSWWKIQSRLMIQAKNIEHELVIFVLSSNFWTIPFGPDIFLIGHAILSHGERIIHWMVMIKNAQPYDVNAEMQTKNNIYQSWVSMTSNTFDLSCCSVAPWNFHVHLLLNHSYFFGSILILDVSIVVVGLWIRNVGLQNE